MKIEKNSAGYFVKTKVKKICPFCGGNAEIDEYDEAMVYEPSYYYQGEQLTCLGCGVFFRYGCKDKYDREEKRKARLSLLKKWNKRI